MDHNSSILSGNYISIDSSSWPGSQYHINIKTSLRALIDTLQLGTMLLDSYSSTSCDLHMVYVLATICLFNTQEDSTEFCFQTCLCSKLSNLPRRKWLGGTWKKPQWQRVQGRRRVTPSMLPSLSSYPSFFPLRRECTDFNWDFIHMTSHMCEEGKRPNGWPPLS